MTRQRRHFGADQKVALLRLHLLEKKPVSDICQEHDLSVTLFYLWQKQLFENGAVAFERKMRAAGPTPAERQVEAHLASHLERLPASDLKSRAVVEQMRQDEVAHGAHLQRHA